MAKQGKKIGRTIGKALPNKKPFIKLTREQIEMLTKASDIALGIIATAGIATVTFAAPNVLQALDKLFFHRKNKNYSSGEKRNKTIYTFYYLRKRGLISMHPEGNDFRIFLTKLGKKKVTKLSQETIAIPKAKIWNKKWWQVAADIPTEHHRMGADLLRKKLKELHFFPLQRTLWLYPFDPRNEMNFLSKYLGIDKFLTIMEINRLDTEDEKRIKKFFKTLNIL